MESLSATVDARDAYTAGHSRRVQQLALAIGRELGLSHVELDLLGHAALFHDIGKLAIPDSILLEAREPDGGGVGADAAPRRRGRPHHRPARLPRRRRPGDPPPPRALRRHRLSRPPEGEEIPLGARIIHVADALDSMLTTRIYRAARPLDEALAELRRRGDLPVLPALRRRRSSGSCRSMRSIDASTRPRLLAVSLGLNVRPRRGPCRGGARPF